MKLAVLLFTLASFVLASCQQHSPECKKPTELNPNGDSELALLMRLMFEESDSLKQLIVEGKKLSELETYQNIHEAIPTDPTVRGPVFEAFAVAYINSIKELETEDYNTVIRFNRMVDQCMNCHTEFCPGPKKKIKKLYIGDASVSSE